MNGLKLILCLAVLLTVEAVESILLNVDPDLHFVLETDEFLAGDFPWGWTLPNWEDKCNISIKIDPIEGGVSVDIHIEVLHPIENGGEQEIDIRGWEIKDGQELRKFKEFIDEVVKVFVDFALEWESKQDDEEEFVLQVPLPNAIENLITKWASGTATFQDDQDDDVEMRHGGHF